MQMFPGILNAPFQMIFANELPIVAAQCDVTQVAEVWTLKMFMKYWVFSSEMLFKPLMEPLLVSCYLSVSSFFKFNLLHLSPFRLFNFCLLYALLYFS